MSLNPGVRHKENLRLAKQTHNLQNILGITITLKKIKL